MIYSTIRIASWKAPFAFQLQIYCNHCTGFKTVERCGNEMLESRQSRSTLPCTCPPPRPQTIQNTHYRIAFIYHLLDSRELGLWGQSSSFVCLQHLFKDFSKNRYPCYTKQDCNAASSSNMLLQLVVKVPVITLTTSSQFSKTYKFGFSCILCLSAQNEGNDCSLESCSPY